MTKTNSGFRKLKNRKKNFFFQKKSKPEELKMNLVKLKEMKIRLLEIIYFMI